MHYRRSQGGNQKLQYIHHTVKFVSASPKKGKKHTKYTDEFAFYLFKYLVSKYINIQPKSPT